MKYLIFAAVSLLGVPIMAMASASNTRLRGILLTALIVATALGDMANINFVSEAYYRGPERGFEVSLADLITWGLILGMLFGSFGKLCWLPYNSLWMFVLFGIAFGTVMASTERLLGFFTLFKFLRMYAVFWCVVNCLRTGVPRKYVWYGLTILAFLLSGYAFEQRYVEHLTRIPGPFDNHNTNPSYVNQIIPILLLWGLYGARLSRIQVLLSVLGVFGMVFVVLATLSRAGLFLSLGCVFGGLALANYKARTPKVTGLTIAICLIFLIGAAKAADTVIDRFEHAPAASLLAREEFLRSAKMMVADHPWGVGLNNFSYTLTTVHKYRAFYVVMVYEKQGGVVHNIYWLTLAELGYPGLIVFVIILARFLWLAIYYARHFSSIEAVLLAGVAISFSALYAAEFLEWTLRISPVFYLFAIVSGICVALAEKVANQRAGQPAEGALWRLAHRWVWGVRGRSFA